MIAMSKKIRGEKRKKIYEIIQKKGKISLKEIRALSGINYNTIRSSVIGLTKARLIKRIERGVYQSK
jgi:DeoR/GlpR family transcriptional regulator of sugar metabolism